ncbi:hypothetical protein MtrunA17_Chr4g0011091 [Medicago truncatula]|uniref:Leguminosin group486 secreted peptide n=1 Tax=Medicago truncatula TaxID=3880 RepID=G7JEJ8_MEDTR|nr:leguminosin group486 secreted peptide [Medicago truncatula]RHN59237.1 hypothetical protein MtrunA17_Chr4g0011091 [Medicago truncatula]
MLAKCYVVLFFFLTLISSLGYSSNDAKLQEIQHKNAKFFIALPSGSLPVYFDCEEMWGQFEMHAGEIVERSTPTNEGVGCTVFWVRLYAYIVARIDEFWIIKTDGLFSTIDHIHWTKVISWRNNTRI